DRIFQRVMSLDDLVEAMPISGFLVIGMVALGKITKHPVNRSRIRIRADFQHFVIVDELRSFHCTPPPGPCNRSIGGNIKPQRGSGISCRTILVAKKRQVVLSVMVKLPRKRIAVSRDSWKPRKRHLAA